MSDSSNSIERPKLLAFLCMLTFISSVSGLITQSENLWSPGVRADETLVMFEQLQKNMEAQSTDENAALVESMFSSIYETVNADTVRLNAIIMLIYESLTLFGAYLMWTFQKQGYYYYLVGVVIVVIAPILLIGGWFGLVTMFLSGFFSTIFAFLYRSQLKYMD